MIDTREGKQDFARLYADALGFYLYNRDEEGLSAAYELGRRALARGFGILDMVAVHRAAIATILPRAKGHQHANFDAAEDYFREMLSPFEMMFRGSIEANTELRRVNDAILREKAAVVAANAELESFSYSVSHDLRAPLRAIAGFNALLAERETGPLNDEQGDCVAHVRDGATIMKRLIDDLLSLSRVAHADMIRTSVDLCAMARDVVQDLKSADPSRGVDVRIPESIVVDADQGLLRVIMVNLLGNAWKFTSKKPEARIELGVLVEKSETAYFVRDNGAGFDMEYAKKLFGPFQRLHTTSEFEGTGIGLATVLRIVRRHGGRVWAEGKPNEGAVFYFTLGERDSP